MIEAKHLRIGNKIYQDGIEVTVEAVSKGSISFKDNEGNEGFAVNILDWFTPIPLSEDWLLKAGFEDWGIIDINQYEIEHHFVLHNVLDGTSSFKVCKQMSTYDGKCYEEWIIKVDHDIIPFKRVEFIHDVQNCFNLISGEELTFKM